MALIRDQARFAEVLLKTEDRYQKSELLKLNKRIAEVERNTHWVLALGISVVTGLTFCLTGPFASAWLQPAADELFSRAPKPEVAAKADPTPSLLPQTVQFITNNYYAKSPSNTNVPHKPKQVSQRHVSVCSCDRK